MKKKLISLILAAALSMTCFAAVSATEKAKTDISAFCDLDAAAYYYNSVEYCMEHGLMVGVSPTHFNPNGAMTRAMFVTDIM